MLEKNQRVIKNEIPIWRIAAISGMALIVIIIRLLLTTWSDNWEYLWISFCFFFRLLLVD